MGAELRKDESKQWAASIEVALLLYKGGEDMATHKNLKPLNTRTKEEQREIQRKGGVASGAARRRKRTERELALMIANSKVVDEDDIRELAECGLEGEDATYLALMLLHLFQKAMNGDIPAIKEYRNIAGTDNAAKDLELREEEAKRKEKELEMKVEKFEEENW